MRQNVFELKKIWIIGKDSIFRTFFNTKIYIAIILAMIIFSPYVSAIKEFSTLVNINVNGWVLPYIMTNKFAQVIVAVGAVFIFSDVPFDDASNEWIILRAGKKNWYWGKVLYILLMSVIMAILYFIVSIVILVPRLQFELRWGKILGTLAQMNTDSIKLDYSIQLETKPIQACAYSIVLIMLIMFLIGLMVMVFNILFKMVVGQTVGLFVAFMAMVAPNFSNLFAAYYFSPASWMDITNLISGNISRYPTAIYIFGTLAAAYIVFSISGMIAASYMEGVIRK